jgi:hypothetical protein
MVQCMIFPCELAYWYTKVIWFLSIVLFLVAGVLEGYGGIEMKSYLGLSIMTYCALLKAASTATKYAYQVYLNFQKK